ncbi:MAG TPA: hypothetical protein PKE54_16690, partial [Candidatus Obscuribacter sp.]|nr:hypothetical protein [Candidatus Obscuribacter sp.]
MTSVILLLALAAITWLALSPRLCPKFYHRFLFHPHKELGKASEIETLVQTYGGTEYFFRT